METPPEPREDEPVPVKDEEIDTNWDEAIETFDNMELREELLRGIYAYGLRNHLQSSSGRSSPC
jgi:translation initiation factor 4A